jgi:hypothetical protein
MEVIKELRSGAFIKAEIDDVTGELFFSSMTGDEVGRVTLPDSGGGPGGPVSWDCITDKPDTFPPSAHYHTVSDITDLDLSDFATHDDIDAALVTEAEARRQADDELRGVIDANEANAVDTRRFLFGYDTAPGTLGTFRGIISRSMYANPMQDLKQDEYWLDLDNNADPPAPMTQVANVYRMIDDGGSNYETVNLTGLDANINGLYDMDDVINWLKSNRAWDDNDRMDFRIYDSGGSGGVVLSQPVYIQDAEWINGVPTLPAHHDGAVPSGTSDDNYLINRAMLDSAMATVPGGGLRVPLEVALESTLRGMPLSSYDVGAYYYVQNMDVSMPNRTGKMWANFQGGVLGSPVVWYASVDQYFDVDGVSAVLTPSGQIAVNTGWLNGIIGYAVSAHNADNAAHEGLFAAKLGVNDKIPAERIDTNPDLRFVNDIQIARWDSLPEVLTADNLYQFAVDNGFPGDYMDWSRTILNVSATEWERLEARRVWETESVFGVEYWTGKRHVDGKMIYGKKIDFGALSAANVSRYIPHGISNMLHLTSAGAIAVTGDFNYQYALSNAYATIEAGLSNVGIISHVDMRAYTAFITLEYICTDR